MVLWHLALYHFEFEFEVEFTGFFLLEHYLANRSLLSAGHLARIQKNRLTTPKAPYALVDSGAPLQHHLARLIFPAAFAEGLLWRRIAPGGTSP